MTENNKDILPLTPENLPQNLTAEEAASLWFEHKYGEKMPDSVTSLFKSLIRTEIKRKQAENSLLTTNETSKLNEALRLNDTKLKNIENSLDKIRQQQEWYRKFITLSHSLEKEKNELYRLNKQYASVQKAVQDLERFETFESQQGCFQRIEFIGQLRDICKEQIHNLHQEKEKAEKQFNQTKEKYQQQTLKRKDNEAALKHIDDLLTEVYMNNGKLQILELNEEKVLEAIHVISVASKLPENRIKEAVIKLINEQQILFMESVNSVAQAVSNLTDASILSAEALSKCADSILNTQKEGPENSLTNNVPVFFMSDRPIAVDLCSDEIFREKDIYLDSNTYGKESYTATIEIPYTTEFERFRQNIVDSQILVVRRNYYDQERYESQHEISNRNRHTSRHVPFYFSIVGQNRHVPRNDGKKYQTKFNRNVRPKGTHSHFKFYR